MRPQPPQESLMKIMIVIEDTRAGGVEIHSYRTNPDGSLASCEDTTPANQIACTLENLMQHAKKQIDESGAARCWH
jgi:hypothetical protein